jgi:hypothetical protein
MIDRDEFRYKDANRDWWLLVIERGRAQRNDAVDAVDHWWSYTLSREDCGSGGFREVWRGEVFAQYDLVPSINTVMKDFACQAAILAVGFAAESRP